MPTHTTVLIVGAGPTGLTMALILQLYNIPFLIVDKQVKPVTTSNALTLHMHTSEIWDDLKLINDALAIGDKIQAVHMYENNEQLVTFNFNKVNVEYPFVLGIAQHNTENIMIEHLKSKNISIAMEIELIDFQHHENGIVATLQDKEGSKTELHADWLIACDGGHSTVRNKLNIPFIGKELAQHFVLADFEGTFTQFENKLTGFFSDQGVLLFIPFNKNCLRIIAEVSKDPELKMAKSLTDEQIQRLISTRSNLKVDLFNSKKVWTSGFWLHERIASKYRDQRIFLAGDAAHIHSPAGGQGMNTGIHDAYNLAWKLALVIQGKVKPDILATYQEERYPVAKDVLRNTTRITRIVSIRNLFLLRLRNFFIRLALKFAKLRQNLIEKLGFLNIHYKDNLLIKECLPQQKGPLAGTRFIDVKYNNQRLLDKLQSNNFNLLIFAGDGAETNMETFLLLQKLITEKYQDLIACILISTTSRTEKWQGQMIFDAKKDLHQTYGVSQESRIYLIRPDKYIGFRGDATHGKEFAAYLAGFLTATHI